MHPCAPTGKTPLLLKRGVAVETPERLHIAGHFEPELVRRDVLQRPCTTVAGRARAVAWWRLAVFPGVQHRRDAWDCLARAWRGLGCCSALSRSGLGLRRGLLRVAGLGRRVGRWITGAVRCVTLMRILAVVLVGRCGCGGGFLVLWSADRGRLWAVVVRRWMLRRGVTGSRHSWRVGSIPCWVALIAGIMTTMWRHGSTVTWMWQTRTAHRWRPIIRSHARVTVARRRIRMSKLSRVPAVRCTAVVGRVGGVWWRSVHRTGRRPARMRVAIRRRWSVVSLVTRSMRVAWRAHRPSRHGGNAALLVDCGFWIHALFGPNMSELRIVRRLHKSGRGLR